MKSIDIDFQHIDRYMVGQNIKKNKRTFQNCSIVIYLKERETMILKSLNEKLLKSLEDFNKINGCKYSLQSDLLPENFIPHVTLAQTKHVNECLEKAGNSIDRCYLIKSLNEVLNNMNRKFRFSAL